MSKSPINILGAIAGGLIAGRGKKKTARALKKIDKRLSGIESKIDAASTATISEIMSFCLILKVIAFDHVS